jgi:hypothetical protein
MPLRRSDNATALLIQQSRLLRRIARERLDAYKKEIALMASALSERRNIAHRAAVAKPVAERE